MAMLVRADYDTVSKYRGRSVYTLVGSKKQKVYFVLICDDLNLAESINLAKASKNILMVEYQGLVNNEVYQNINTNQGIYIGVVRDFGCNISEEDIIGVLDEVPEGITPIFNVPVDFKDLNFVWKMCNKYSRIRFSGGTLFNINGVRLGRIGVDILESEKIKFSMDCYKLVGTLDVMEVISSDGLVFESGGKVESKTPKSSTKSSSSEKKSKSSGGSKKTVMFSDLLGVKNIISP